MLAAVPRSPLSGVVTRVGSLSQESRITWRTAVSLSVLVTINRSRNLVDSHGDEKELRMASRIGVQDQGLKGCSAKFTGNLQIQMLWA